MGFSRAHQRFQLFRFQPPENVNGRTTCVCVDQFDIGSLIAEATGGEHKGQVVIFERLEQHELILARFEATATKQIAVIAELFAHEAAAVVTGPLVMAKTEVRYGDTVGGAGVGGGNALRFGSAAGKEHRGVIRHFGAADGVTAGKRPQVMETSLKHAFITPAGRGIP